MHEMTSLRRDVGKKRLLLLQGTLVLFGLWLALMVGALLLEHTAIGHFVFRNRFRATVYLGLQTALTAMAFIGCAIILVRGTNRMRLIVFLPAIILALYAMILIAGPG